MLTIVLFYFINDYVLIIYNLYLLQYITRRATYLFLQCKTFGRKKLWRSVSLPTPIHIFANAHTLYIHPPAVGMEVAEALGCTLPGR